MPMPGPESEFSNQATDDIHDEAKRLMYNYNTHVTQRDLAESRALYRQDKADSMYEAIRTIDGIPGAPESQSKLQERATEYTHESANALKLAENEELKRKATLWDAREHYQANQEAYVEAAKKEAAAAGHDIVDKAERVRRSFGSPM